MRGKAPSVETFMHAVCLQEAGAKWIGHCHPVSVLQILCSKQGVAPFLQHVFPDEIVVCGRIISRSFPISIPASNWPGRYARHCIISAKSTAVRAKVILLANHGPVALGQTDRDVLNILLMLDKWARILVGNFALGGPQFLPDSTSTRIDTRPDEHYRRAQIAALSK